MEESEGLCLPLILLNRESSDKSAGRNGNNNFSNSSMTRTAVVPKDSTNKYSGPNPTPKSRKLIAEPRLPKHSMMENKYWYG